MWNARRESRDTYYTSALYIKDEFLGTALRHLSLFLNFLVLHYTILLTESRYDGSNLSVSGMID